MILLVFVYETPSILVHGQGKNICVNRTSQLKNVDLGSVKKKLDLPVQKNLLTKYFCILWIPFFLVWLCGLVLVFFKKIDNVDT